MVFSTIILKNLISNPLIVSWLLTKSVIYGNSFFCDKLYPVEKRNWFYSSYCQQSSRCNKIIYQRDIYFGLVFILVRIWNCFNLFSDILVCLIININYCENDVIISETENGVMNLFLIIIWKSVKNMFQKIKYKKLLNNMQQH